MNRSAFIHHWLLLAALLVAPTRIDAAVGVQLNAKPRTNDISSGAVSNYLVLEMPALGTNSTQLISIADLVTNTLSTLNPGGGSGEANVLADAGTTNAARISQSNGKSGVSLLLKTEQAGYGILKTNQGTNLVTAIDPAVVASQADLTAKLNATNGTMRPASSDGPALTIRGLSGQDGDLFKVQDVSGNQLFSVTYDGGLAGPGVGGPKFSIAGTPGQVWTATNNSGQGTWSNAPVSGALAGITTLTNGGNLSNAVFNLAGSTNRVLRLGPGVYDVTRNLVPDKDTLAGTPLLFDRLTNFIFEGSGPGTIIYSPGRGNLAGILNCSNVVFRNFRVVSNRATNEISDGLFYEFLGGGVSSDIVFDNVRFDDCPANIICGNVGTGRSPRWTVQNCSFYHWGWSNTVSGGLIIDGTAVVPTDDEWNVGPNNLFYGGIRGVELYNNFNGNVRRTRVFNNRFERIEHFGVGIISAGSTEFDGLSIENNTFYDFGVSSNCVSILTNSSQAAAIYIPRGRNIRIAGNHIDNMFGWHGHTSPGMNAIDTETFNVLSDVQIVGNTIKRARGRAIRMVGTGSIWATNVLIQGNTIQSNASSAIRIASLFSSQISDNAIWDNATLSPVAGIDVFFFSEQLKIANNRFGNSPGGANQTPAITIPSTATNVSVIDNSFFNTATDVSDSGVGTKIMSLTDPELIEWSGISTNRVLTTNHAQLGFFSTNGVKVVAGTGGITVTAAASGSAPNLVHTFTISDDDAGGSGSTNPPVLARGWGYDTNAVTAGVTNLGTNATVTFDLMGPPVANYGIFGNSTINLTNLVAFTNHPGGRKVFLKVRQSGVSGTLTITPIGPHPIDWQGNLFLAQNATNTLLIEWDGTQFTGSRSHAETTGSGAYALSNAPSLFAPAINSATASRVAVFDGQSPPRLTNAAAVDLTELGYLDGVTSALQTQLNGKQNGQTNANQFGASTTLTIKKSALATNLVNLFEPVVVTGTGGANTNFTLQAIEPEVSINGFTNVSIRAVMQTDPSFAAYLNVTITNLSGSDRTLEFSAVTNRWRFSGVYGTNAPSTITNNTALLLSLRCLGTNTLVGYSYFTAP